MMKLLVANVRAKSLPGISITIGPKDQFLSELDIIRINPVGYDSITGITKNPLCGVDRSGALVEKYDTIGEALFHELCRIFHWKSGILTVGNIDRQTVLSGIYTFRKEKMLWTNDEEIWTISGGTFGGLDPICCNMFDICKYASAPEFIVQMVFHWTWNTLKRCRNPIVLRYRINQFLIDISQYVLTKS